jgi:hypothetical protein
MYAKLTEVFINMYPKGFVMPPVCESIFVHIARIRTGITDPILDLREGTLHVNADAAAGTDVAFSGVGHYSDTRALPQRWAILSQVRSGGAELVKSLSTADVGLQYMEHAERQRALQSSRAGTAVTNDARLKFETKLREMGVGVGEDKFAAPRCVRVLASCRPFSQAVVALVNALNRLYGATEPILLVECTAGGLTASDAEAMAANESERGVSAPASVTKQVAVALRLAHVCLARREVRGATVSDAALDELNEALTVGRRQDRLAKAAETSSSAAAASAASSSLSAPAPALSQAGSKRPSRDEGEEDEDEDDEGVVEVGGDGSVRGGRRKRARSEGWGGRGWRGNQRRG